MSVPQLLFERSSVRAPAAQTSGQKKRKEYTTCFEQISALTGMGFPELQCARTLTEMIKYAASCL